MFRELIDIFQPNNSLRAMSVNFEEMLRVTLQMNLKAGQIFFGECNDTEDISNIHRQDAEVNALERVIRRQVITHLALPGNQADIPYCLLLISLAKDVERLGDYAKNLSEISEVRPHMMDKSESSEELLEIRQSVESAFRNTSEVFLDSDRNKAVQLIYEGRKVARRCDKLIRAIGRADYDAGTAVSLILGSRYYKRIGGHLLNVLSSVVMPLDKIDYYDESEIDADLILEGTPYIEH